MATSSPKESQMLKRAGADDLANIIPRVSQSALGFGLPLFFGLALRPCDVAAPQGASIDQVSAQTA